VRPVNLIPSEQRTGRRAGLRGGPLAYIVVGALVLLLAGLTLLVATNNQISDRKAEISELRVEVASAEARADKLAAYTALGQVREQRVATVSSLADSRFDWERVMRELSLVLPADVWLTNLTGTVAPDVSVEGSGGVSLRTSIPGPALELSGCARSQDAVAGFVTDLRDIDGVTRVGVQSTLLGSQQSSAGATSDSAPSSGGSSSCQTKSFIAQFQIVAAFDAAPIPASTEGSG
jgi:Tfp pilus assembly protein PilN